MLSILLNNNNVNIHDCIKRLWSATYPYVSGLEIWGSKFYNVCIGKVIAVGRERNNTISVSVLVNDIQMIRYCNLTSCAVKAGQDVGFSTLIGTCSRYLRFEYCSTTKEGSTSTVRIKSRTFYTHDPYGLIDGTLRLTVIVDNVDTSEVEELVKLDKYQLDEFTGNRGDD